MPTWMLVAGGIMLVMLAFLASQMMGGSAGRGLLSTPITSRARLTAKKTISMMGVK